MTNPLPTNVSTVVDLWEYNDTVVGDEGFSYFILFAIWLVAFFASSITGRQDYAIVGASFVTMLVASLLVVAGLVSMGPLLLSIAVMIGGFLLSRH